MWFSLGFLAGAMSVIVFAVFLGAKFGRVE